MTKLWVVIARLKTTKMIKSTLIEYLRQQIKQAKEDWNNHDSYCIEITPDQANLIVKELGQTLPIDSVSKCPQCSSVDIDTETGWCENCSNYYD